MKHSKKLVALMVLCLMVLNSVAVFAENGDVWTKTPKAKYGAASDLILDSNKLDPILLTPEDYLYEHGNKLYEMTDLNNEFAKDDVNYVQNLVKNQTGSPVPGSLPTLEITSDEKEILANGRAGTIVRIKVMKDGKLDETADNMTATVHTTYGKLAKEKVTIQDGTAEVYLTSETLTQLRTAVITVIITDAEHNDYINIRNEYELTMNPNAEPGGARLVSAEAAQADRIIMFFDKEVDAKKIAQKGYKVKLLTSVDMADSDKLLPNGARYTEADIAGLLPVEGNSKALQLLLKVADQKILVDNARINLTFETTHKGIKDIGQAIFNLTDARKPEMTKVEGKNIGKGKATVTVTFSEAVYYKNASELIDATKLDNWAIDGEFLTKYPATIKVGDTISEKSDDRHIVTIELPVNLAEGKHSIQAANIGDWAALTHIDNNIMDTQTLDFDVKAWNEADPGAPDTGELAVVWAYADKDMDPVEVNGFTSNDDALAVKERRDYIRIRFNQPLRKDGRETTALSNDNYTLNGQKFPIGTQIIFAETHPEPGHINQFLTDKLVQDPTYLTYEPNSEILIILPEGVVADPKATVINLSELIEAEAKDADGNHKKLGANADEFKLPYNIVEMSTLNPDQQAADKVMNMIKALPPVSTIVDEASAKAADPAVKAARAAFNALTAAQKKLVTNEDVLKALEAEIAKHVKSATLTNLSKTSLGLGFYEIQGKVEGVADPTQYKVKVQRKGKALLDPTDSVVTPKADGTFKTTVQLNLVEEAGIKALECVVLDASDVVVGGPTLIP